MSLVLFMHYMTSSIHFASLTKVNSDEINKSTLQLYGNAPFYYELKYIRFSIYIV